MTFEELQRLAAKAHAVRASVPPMVQKATDAVEKQMQILEQYRPQIAAAEAQRTAEVVVPRGARVAIEDRRTRWGGFSDDELSKLHEGLSHLDRDPADTSSLYFEVIDALTDRGVDLGYHPDSPEGRRQAERRA